MENFNALSRPMRDTIIYCMNNAQQFVADMHLDMTLEEQNALTIGDIRESVARAAKEFFAQEIDPDCMDSDKCPPHIALCIDERIASFQLSDLI